MQSIMRTSLLVVGAALLALETSALRNDEDGDTISETMWTLSKRPFVPFAAGMLCGHFFWQKYEDT
jgi:hypothetical protein